MVLDRKVNHAAPGKNRRTGVGEGAEKPEAVAADVEGRPGSILV